MPRTTALLALSLTLLSGDLLTTPRPAVAATPAVDAPTGKPSAPDVASALAEAKRFGKRVEALSERTETSTTWVNQDGSLTSELTAGPVRFDRNGSWVTVDTDLTERRDGTVAPMAHPASLTLAGKGGTPASSLGATRTAGALDLVTLGEGEQQVTLQRKGGLPQPELDGSRATYPDAVRAPTSPWRPPVRDSSSTSRSSTARPRRTTATPSRCVRKDCAPGNSRTGACCSRTARQARSGPSCPRR
ncbi:hypothetical protein [Streptomyces sp. AK010]|uniref:hypothetical protein n=1 Tax=Streptomyces sp. AK010 TaxID=2723074 RepID=UPI0018406FFC|nr:hypothetical protein [Streptomyces sp. AK010]